MNPATTASSVPALIGHPLFHVRISATIPVVAESRDGDGWADRRLPALDTAALHADAIVQRLRES
ncbi:MAG TPA: hypothetical protein VIR81_03365 [Myxococcales bacterium]